jgi:ATP synthase protein I
VTEQDPTKRPSSADPFARSVGTQEKRKLKASRTRAHVWSGLGMMGLIGWSIGAPTLLGAVLGLWLDKKHPGASSWTLGLLIAGLCIGCGNAWHWIVKEQNAIHRGEDDE